MPVKRPLGIVILGPGFILTSLWNIIALMDIKNYYYLFQSWPGEFVAARFVILWATRLLGIASGVGLLYRKEWARKAVCGLSCFAILFVYWKYPYDEFLRHAEKLDELLNFSDHGLSIASLAFMSCITAWIIEVAWPPGVLYYLTRQRIKGYFVSG